MSDLIERLRREGYTIGGWDDALSELEAQQAEIARLRKLVLSAFEEGFRLGAWRGDFKREGEWKESDSCTALDQKP